MGDPFETPQDQLAALTAELLAAEDEIRALEARRVAEVAPRQRKNDQLVRTQSAWRHEREERKTQVKKLNDSLQNIGAQVERLDTIERSLAALRYVVAGQRRAIVAAYTKYMYNKASTSQAQVKERETGESLEKLIESITSAGVRTEQVTHEFSHALKVKESEIEGHIKELDAAIAELDSQFSLLEELEAAAQAGELKAVKEAISKHVQEAEDLRSAYDELKLLEQDVLKRRQKAYIEVIRSSVNHIMGEAEENVTDIDRSKHDQWGTPVRINLIQYLSVEWESFDHPMRVSTQEKTGVYLQTLPKPFAKGTFRTAWYAKDSAGNEYIAKKFHASWRRELNELMEDKSDEAGRRRDRESVGKVIQMNRVCQVALLAFETALKRVGYDFEMSFVDIWMAEEMESGQVWFLEEPLPIFDRFTNNADYADDTTDEGRLMSCFEHFSFEFYGRRFIVTGAWIFCRRFGFELNLEC